MNKLLKNAKEFAGSRIKVDPTDDELEVVVALLNGEISNSAAALVLNRCERTLNAYLTSYIKVGIRRGRIALTFKKK